jgi:TetR/AcrR family transcriptional repressor of nem operon
MTIIQRRDQRPETPRRGAARASLLDAAVTVIRSKGYAATTVDDVCAAAGVSKGAFFHHFESKEALAVAAADHWSTTTGALFDGAEFHHLEHPADRVLGYLDLRAAIIEGPLAEFTCLVGTMAQETFESWPTIRDASGASILGHAATLEADIHAALIEAGHVDDADAEARSLAVHTQAVIQGAFVVAKAADDPDVARASIEHLRRYIAFRLDRNEAIT